MESNTPSDQAPAPAAPNIGTTWGAAIKTQINGNRKHGWGVDDSLAVINAMWRFENGDDIPEEAAARIRKVINPSAFRLYLESKAVNLLDVQEKVKGKGDDMSKDLK